MTSNFKNKLLLGTALVAVGAFALPAYIAPAYAADEIYVDENDGDDGVYETDVDTAVDLGTYTGHDIQFRGNATTINVANGEIIGGSSTTTGAITASTLGNDATGDTLTITNDVDDATASITIRGDIDDGDTDDFNLTFAARTEDSDNDESLTVDVQGSINLGAGDLTITSDDTNNGSQANQTDVSVSGDITAALIAINVGDANSDGDEDTDVTLTLDGTTAQTVTVTNITTAEDSEGTIAITNDAGATFTGTIAATGTELANIDVGSDNGASSVTFQGNTYSTALTLSGDGDGDTVTVNLDASGGDREIEAAIAVDNAADDHVINVTGGNTFTIDQDQTVAVDTVNVTGTGTKLSVNTFLAGTINIGSGAFLQMDAADTVTANIEGVSDGVGTFDVTENTTLVGSVGATNSLALLTIEAGDTLTVDGDTDAAAVTVDATSIVLEGAGATLTLDGDDGSTVTINGAITTGADSEGVINTNDDGGTAVTYTFTGNVGISGTELDSYTSGGAGVNDVIVAQGNWYVETTDLDDEDVFRLTGSSVTVGGVIEGEADSDGIIEVGDGTNATSATFTSAIGGTNDVEQFIVKAGSTAVVSNGILAASDAAAVAGLQVEAGATLDINAASVDLVFDNTTNGDVDFNGTVDITGTSANINIAATDDLDIDGTFSTVLSGTSKELTLTSDANDINIGEASDTTITAGNQIITASTAVNFGATGRANTLNIRKTDDFDPTATAVIDADTNNTVVTVNTDATLSIGIDASSQSLDDGDTITVIDSDQNATTSYATLLTNGDIVLVDSGLLDLQDDSSDAQDLKIKIVAKDASDVYSSGATGVGAANSLLSLGSTAATGELSTIRGSLLAASASEGEEIAESIAPTVDAGATAAGFTVANTSADIVQTSVLAAANGETGATAGNISQGLRAWGQVFGKTAEQDKRDGVDGYEADTYGVAVGIDTETLADRWIWGLAFAYANTEVDSNNANRTETEVDTYQLTLYANYDWDDATYITGQLGYAFGENETTRNDVGAVAGLTARGDYDSDQFLARVEAGRSYEVGSNTTLTPNLMVNYVHYDADNYTETGAGNANLVVDTDEVNVFELGAAVDASWLYQQADGSYLKPEARLGVRYDFADDEAESTSSFTGGGAAFQTKGFDPAQFTLDAGVGVTYFTTSNWELTANYDFEYKEDYDAHAGYLRAAYKF